MAQLIGAVAKVTGTVTQVMTAGFSFNHARDIKRFQGVLKTMFKVGLSPPKQNSFYLLQWKPFKNDEKCFLFHLKNSFRSQDICTSNRMVSSAINGKFDEW